MASLDLPLGASSRSPGRTAGQLELILHHLIGAARPLHVNADFVRSHTRFREPIVAGGLVTALVAAGWPSSELCRRLEREHGLEFDDEDRLEMRYLRALQPGDTLHSVYTLLSQQSERDTGRLMVGLAGELADGRRVVEGRLRVSYRLRPTPG